MQIHWSEIYQLSVLRFPLTSHSICRYVHRLFDLQKHIFSSMFFDLLKYFEVPWEKWTWYLFGTWYHCSSSRLAVFWGGKSELPFLRQDVGVLYPRIIIKGGTAALACDKEAWRSQKYWLNISSRQPLGRGATRLRGIFSILYICPPFPMRSSQS